jgi:Ca-activated chloride channel family protein
MNLLDLLFGQLYWREPLWLLLGLFPFALLMWKRAMQRASLRHYADSALHPWVRAARTSNQDHGLMVSQFMAWLLIAIAASGPRFLIVTPEELQPAEGAAVIIVDHSRSMRVNDVNPDRLQLAHNMLEQWGNQTYPPKTGLILFSGGAHVALPPTSDRQALKQAIQMVREVQLPTYGSAVASSLKKATSLLINEEGERAIILLTDGDYQEREWQQLNRLVTQASARDIGVHILGIGTPSPIAIIDSAGRWLTHKGEAVTTRLYEPELRALAANPGVTYSRLNPQTHQQLSSVWQPRATRLAKEYQDQVLWRELFPWLLVPAMLLLIFQHIRIREPATKITTNMASVLVTILIVSSLLQPRSGYTAEGDLQLAYKAWQLHEYEKAAALYEKIDGYDARMGEGASCFRMKNPDCAITAFSQAAWQADTDQQRGVAAYNLGNSFFLQGNFPSAITLYHDALRYQPSKKQYLNNLEFTQEVQQQIELRLRQEAASLDKQLGPGWRTRRVEQGSDLLPDATVSLADDQNSDTASGRRGRMSEEQIRQYMQRRENFASLAKKQGSQYQRQHDWSRFSESDPAAAQQVEFWQRLFEIEENIMVSPDTPRTLEGIAPW